MEFQVVNKYLRETDKTFVAIRCQDPYTAYDRILEGDRMAESDESLIEVVKKIVATEMDPTGAITEMQQKLDMTSKQTDENTEVTERLDKLQTIFIDYTISNGNMPISTYQAISKILPTMKDKKRYHTGDIVQAKYPYDTNPKYPKDSPVILKFIDNWNYNGEEVQVLIQRGAVSIVIPNIQGGGVA
jgi:hypothetical protein